MRHLAAILFIDIVGYTSLMGESEVKALSVVKRLNEISKPLANSYSGTWHKDLGDGTLFSFGSALEAVKCAIAIQQKINFQESFRVRIGIHMGDITFEDGDVFGDGVNIASRIQGEAATGGIAISETVQRSIHNKEGINTIKVGKRKLKNVAGSVGLFQIKAPGVETIISRRRSFNPIFLVVIGMALGYLLNELVINRFSSSSDPSVQRYSLSLPEEMPIDLIGEAPYGAGHRSFDISRDGKMVVYVTLTSNGPMLALRETRSFEVMLLDGTERAFYPFFSPDSKWIGFFTSKHLLKVSVSGLRPVIITEIAEPQGGVWMEDNHIIVSDGGGARLTRISTLDQNSTSNILPTNSHFYWPASLPDPDNILLSTGNRILCYNINTGQSKSIINEGTTPRYLAPGYIIYAHDGRLKAAKFNPDKQEISGPPVPVQDGIRTEAVRKGSQFALSESGDLVFVEGNPVDQGILVYVNRQGEEIATLPIPPDNFGSLSLSPNQKYLLFNSGNNEGLYLYDLARNISSLVQKNGSLNTWSHDGESYTYSARIGDRWVLIDQSVDGRSVDTLLESDKRLGPYSWSYDKRYLIGVRFNEHGEMQNMLLDLSRNDSSSHILTYLPPGVFGDFAPNGKFYVYQDLGEIFVQPLPGTGQKIKISSEGGMDPYWIGGGKEIVYISNNFSKMMSVSVDWTNGFNPGRPVVLWERSYLDVPGRAYSTTPDGSLFLMKKSIETQHTRDKLLVVKNWLQELEKMVQ